LAPFFVYVPLSVYAFMWSLRKGSVSMFSLFALVAIGLFGWTLLEYILHWIVHTGNGTSIGNIVSLLHQGHHRNPSYEAKITTPLYGSLPILIVLLTLLRLIGGSWEVSLMIMTGIVSGYLAYELVHFNIHRSLKRGRATAFRSAAHVFHHHHNQSRCFGVTTPLWDWMFGTDSSSK
jgi:sterol desaturase/sphingolipid hydroxylase (fatty acid hydroxylase superfamily)